MDQHPDNFSHLLTTNAPLDEKATAHFQGRLRALEITLEQMSFGTKKHPKKEPDPAKELLALCLVCRRWREAALNTHRLWSSVDIACYFSPTVSRKVETWLNRSGALPKRLKILAGECEESTTPCHQCKLSNELARFLAEGPRLEHLALQCSTPLCLKGLLNVVKSHEDRSTAGSWDAIKSLRINFSQEWTEREPFNPADTVFLQLPPVTSLGLRLPPLPCLHRQSTGTYNPDLNYYEAVSDVGMALHIPKTTLARLSHLKLHCNWNGARVIDILRSTPSLHSLELGFDGTTQRFGDSSQIRKLLDNNLVFPNLQILRLCKSHCEVYEILQFIQTPSLLELDIDIYHEIANKNDPYTAHILGLLERSSASLRRLRISGTFGIYHVLGKILLSLPSLVHVTMDGVDLNSSVFSQLESATPPALPLLECFELFDANLDEFFLPVEVVIGYFESRKTMKQADGAPLVTTDVIVKTGSPATDFTISNGVVTMARGSAPGTSELQNERV
ncbi:hypothetical protein DFP72DRAFT_841462 [Ephemerocybe angulata]|uniref:F-box domain-containing protein n=1 Tax=Ephemerocybe angulata TaxID=980116 RepID=A0A8H6IFR4_9AGAR|nr:hypothetical protein DFP72DRAFT_841459 [Tulosesus angulatus]KAF6763366.1 hypothetical protein DFP72DRAFT_841462 [Tulosesus angulatus]